MPQCVGSFPGYFHTFVRLAFSGENAIPYTKKEGFYLSLQTALSVMLAGEGPCGEGLALSEASLIC